MFSLNYAVQQWPTETWPTISAGDAESGQTAPNPNRQGGAEHESLRVSAANWPSARAEDSENCGNHPNATDSLNGAVRNWPSLALEMNHALATGTDHPPRLGTNVGVAEAHPSPQAASRQTARRGMDRPPQALWQSPPAGLGAAGCASRSGDRIDEQLLTGQAKHFPSSPPPETTMPDGSAYSALIQLLCRLFDVQTEAEFRAVPKSLNPRFVEFLMGWPKKWASATV
jgi:hypothetical protein